MGKLEAFPELRGRDERGQVRLSGTFNKWSLVPCFEGAWGAGARRVGPEMRAERQALPAAAAEQVRQQMLAQHDQVSKRTLQAMLDASKVLTPEQRAKLGDRMKQRSDTMRDRMKRMMGDRRDAPKS